MRLISDSLIILMGFIIVIVFTRLLIFCHPFNLKILYFTLNSFRLFVSRLLTMVQNEEGLKATFVEALNRIIAEKQEHLLQLKRNIESVLTGGNSESTAKIDAKLADLERQLVAKAEEHEDYTDIASEIYALRKQRDELTMSENARNDYLKRIEELESFIDEQPTKINNFEESLVKRMLKRATVYEDRIIFEFHSGVNVEVNM